ncbi:hypothetical protein [Aquitalea aquatica]|uniref:Uncharacterized protein n=1 Tax=Aquitalea aquatica TaxID=3044273 RepID=A0A838Y0U8_9NEIS|nr:hypothetical protein [Aquitalea magnusonii]MBA4707528.1 hypothetical protein [Aquitalea magnusonii]
MQFSTIRTTRAQAKAIGEKIYFTGEPCIRGHISRRRTANGMCIMCIELKANDRKKYDADRYKNNAESKKAAVKKYREENRDKVLEKRRIYNLRTAEHKRAYMADRRKSLAGTEKYREEKRAYSEKRRKATIIATPAWANIESIKQIYQNCPSGFHVDHIIPLLGKTVCGLHVESNLQYLPAKENLIKASSIRE